jgi:hypothetical protein
MSQLTLYTTGTITFTNASASITGVGTSFIGLQQGDPILGPDGKWYELASAPSDNLAATLDRVYTGTTATNSPGGTGWVIFRSSVSRDSVRTATKQLTDISSVWRQIMNLTQSDQTAEFSKTTTADRAGMILSKALVDMFQVGTFQDDDFSIRYLLASTWTKALGISPTTGATSFYSQILLGGVISPTTLTATTVDYAPANLAQANILRVSTNAARSITGLTTGVPGRVLALMNVGSNELDLENESGTSAAANRFSLGSNLAIPAGGSVLLVYDGVASRWRVMGGSGSGGSGLKGWSPILGYVSNGSGGKGAYIGATGQVATAAEATSVLGPAGDQVQFRMNGAILQWSYVSTVNWQDLYTLSLIVGPPSALQWTFSTTTTDADPGAGKLRFNNATFGSVTQIFIDLTERFGVDVSAYLDTWDDSSNSIKGTLTLIDSAAPQIAVFNVTGITTVSGYRKLAVTPIVGGIFADTRLLSVQFTRAGDKGLTATGTVGTVTTLAAGASATVVNAGTVNDAIFNFGIPQGIQGIQGIQGPVPYKPAATWATGQNYVAGPPADLLVNPNNGSLYVCAVNHTSTGFAADLIAGKLVLLVHGTNSVSSTASLSVGTGSKTFSVPMDIGFKVGARLRASSQASPATFMEGIVTAANQDGTGGTLTINVDKAVGSGTIAAWNINVAGDPGSADFVTIRKFLYTATAGQTTFSGADVNARTLAYTAGYITVVINGSVLAPPDFTATDGASVVLPRGLNAGDSVYIDCSLAYNPADTLAASQNGADVLDKAKFRASLGITKKNYIVNGGMQVSQENGATPGTITGYYPVDQFQLGFANSGTQTAQQAASVTPGGSPNRFRVTATVADTSVGAGEVCAIEHRIEGLRVVDLKLGTVSAKTVTLQFGVRAPAGTYCVAIRNAALNRCYVAEYVVGAGEANTDTVKSVTIALDQTGTWAADNTVGLDVVWSLMTGSSLQTAANSWSAGNFLATSNQFNFMGTNGNVFELFDVGLYEGSSAPAFQLPDYVSELQVCQRYYEASPATNIAGATSAWAHVNFKAVKRATPTVTLTPNTGTVSGVVASTYGAYGQFSVGPTGFTYTATARM